MRTPYVALATVAALAAALLGGAPAHARDTRPPVRDAAEARRGTQPDPGLVPFLGIVTSAAADGLAVTRVVDGSSAARAGLRAGDVIRSLRGRPIAAPSDLETALRASAPGDRLGVALVRDRTLVDVDVTLGARRTSERLFRGASFRLAVVPILFADDVLPPAVAASALRSFFFADRDMRGAGASVRDYFSAQSLGALDLDGRVLEPLRLTRSRAHYASGAMGALSGSPYREAARLLGERRASGDLREFDGIVFLYDGPAETVPGRALWPHRAVIAVEGRPLPYYVHSTETVAGGEIGEHCHEFGHLLGLEDMYGVAHRTGAGDFCVMAIGHRGGPERGAAEPFSMCASCRRRLGWLDCVTVDPATVQRLRLPPVDGPRARAVAVPLDRRTSEYLLLEVRARRGFDAALPSSGLLVWRVGGLPTAGQGAYGSRVDLLEAHGVDTFDASLLRTGEIAFPTARARDLTPSTVPSSRSGRPDAYAVHLTDIVREPDGSVLVTIGVPRDVRQAPPEPYDGARPDADGRVVRTDPITGERVAFDVARGTPGTDGDAATPSRR